MEQSAASGCLVWFISLLLGFGLGVYFLLPYNAQDSVDMLPTIVSTNECTGTLEIASPGVTDPAAVFAYGVHIDYQGETLENAWISIDSSYTRNTLVINSQQYPNVSANHPVTIESNDRLVFYYEGGSVEPIETLSLKTDTEIITCPITPISE